MSREGLARVGVIDAVKAAAAVGVPRSDIIALVGYAWEQAEKLDLVGALAYAPNEHQTHEEEAVSQPTKLKTPISIIEERDRLEAENARLREALTHISARGRQPDAYADECADIADEALSSTLAHEEGG